jgi:hypothetical protein
MGAEARVAELRDDALETSLAVLAPRVEARRPADPNAAGRLVDVAVER